MYQVNEGHTLWHNNVSHTAGSVIDLPAESVDRLVAEGVVSPIGETAKAEKPKDAKPKDASKGEVKAGVKPKAVCAICGQEFANAGLLGKHKKTHGETAKAENADVDSAVAALAP